MSSTQYSHLLIGVVRAADRDASEAALAAGMGHPRPVAFEVPLSATGTGEPSHYGVLAAARPSMSPVFQSVTTDMFGAGTQTPHSQTVSDAEGIRAAWVMVLRRRREEDAGEVWAQLAEWGLLPIHNPDPFGAEA